MDYKLQKFKCVSNNYVGDNISLSEWVSMLKWSDYTEDIKKARTGSKNYNSTKVSLPCVNYPFLFSKYKTNDNILSSTGLLYFDIDDPRFNVSTLDLSKVCLLHKSFGGVGYVIVVRVEGVTKETYKQYYLEIAKELGIEEYVDYNAAKQVQTNVLSYDENPYYNIESKVFNIKCTPTFPNIKKREEERAYREGWGTKSKKGFIFSNLELIDFEGKDYYVDWQSIQQVRCHIPTVKKTEGSRNNMLLAFSSNFLLLNPRVGKKNLVSMIETVDRKGCFPRVGKKRCEKIAESVLKYKIKNKLQPSYGKNRSIVFNEDKNFSWEEKMEIVIDEQRKYWKNKSCTKIQEIIDNWDFEKLGKISVRKIADNNPISKKTVAKYYKHFKEDIKNLNKNLQ